MSPSTDARAYLVESLPTDVDLAPPAGADRTGPTLTRLVNGAQRTIDLTAMYWALQPNPDRRDEKGFSREALLEQFGATEGQALYDALLAAVERGVRLRILQGPGFDDTDDESSDLLHASPSNVAIETVKMQAWYGSGIMHQKIWVFDGRHIYLGSANMDWKSLTQVKEIGVVVENDPVVAGELGRYFETWWAFGALQPDVVHGVFDPLFQIRRTVPAWSALLPAGQRAPNPLDRPEFHTAISWSQPQSWSINGENGDYFLSGAPDALCVGARTTDETALVQTILDAEESVSLCVMDFAPVSLYRGKYDEQRHKLLVDGKVATPVWWPALFDALLHVVTTKALHVRLLISEWAHSSEFITPYLKGLQATAVAAGASELFRTGKLDVRRFRIPGWQKTEPDHDEPNGGSQRYPGHTRVNHTKYIVTDRRVNIGTSNMTWDYFNGTAGASFNTNLPSLVQRAQAIFDRDWESPYASG